MKVRVRMRGAQETEPSMLLELRSEPAAGDLLDSPEYGPCEIIGVVSTPNDGCQDAFAVLQMQLSLEM